MAQKDPTTVASKWATNFGGSTEAWKSGVQAVKVAPNSLAAAAVDTWVANVTAAKPRFVTGNQKVTLQQWQNDTIAKGADRLASGATVGQPKMQAFMSSYLPKVYNAVAQLPARGNYQQNRTRALAMMDALHGMKGSF